MLVIPKNEFFIDVVKLPVSINRSYWLYHILEQEVELRFHLSHIYSFFELNQSNYLIATRIQKNYFKKLNIELVFDGNHINKISCPIQDKLCELIANKQKDFPRQLFEESVILFILSQLADENIGISACKNCVVGNNLDAEKIETVKQFITENLSKHLTIAQLASYIGTNQCYLKKGFKEITQKTIFEFILDERMRKAKNLILHQDLPISEVANKVGYASISSFSQAFKNYYGSSPSHFSLKLK